MSRPPLGVLLSEKNGFFEGGELLIRMGNRFHILILWHRCLILQTGTWIPVLCSWLHKLELFRRLSFLSYVFRPKFGRSQLNEIHTVKPEIDFRFMREVDFPFLEMWSWLHILGNQFPILCTRVHTLGLLWFCNIDVTEFCFVPSMRQNGESIQHFRTATRVAQNGKSTHQKREPEFTKSGTKSGTNPYI